jgi:hypothetical protein
VQGARFGCSHALLAWPLNEQASCVVADSPHPNTSARRAALCGAGFPRLALGAAPRLLRSANPPSPPSPPCKVIQCAPVSMYVLRPGGITRSRPVSTAQLAPECLPPGDRP